VFLLNHSLGCLASLQSIALALFLPYLQADLEAQQKFEVVYKELERLRGVHVGSAAQQYLLAYKHFWEVR